MTGSISVACFYIAKMSDCIAKKKCTYFASGSLQISMFCLLSAFVYEWVCTNGLLCPALEI